MKLVISKGCNRFALPFPHSFSTDFVLQFQEKLAGIYCCDKKASEKFRGIYYSDWLQLNIAEFSFVSNVYIKILCWITYIFWLALDIFYLAYCFSRGKSLVRDFLIKLLILYFSDNWLLCDLLRFFVTFYSKFIQSFYFLLLFLFIIFKNCARFLKVIYFSIILSWQKIKLFGKLVWLLGGICMTPK